MMRAVESDFRAEEKVGSLRRCGTAKKFARSAAADFEERYLGFGTYFTDAMKERLYADDLRPQTSSIDAYRHHREYFAHVRTHRRSTGCCTSISRHLCRR